MTNDSESPFGKRTVVALVVVGGLAFLGAAAVAVFGDDLTPARSAGPTAFSRSALGHRAFADVMRRFGAPVSISRYASAEKAGATNVLIVAEPRRGAVLDGSASALLSVPNWAYVLPKRSGRPAASGVDRIEHSELLPLETVQDALDLVGEGGEAFRGEANDWTTDGLEAAPVLNGPQLIRDSNLEPVVWTDQGLLIGRVPGVLDRFVFADPDLIATHGLADGDNAHIAMSVIERIRGGGGGSVVFDETIHGLTRKPSVWLFLFENPMLVGTISAIFALVVFLWSATGRFGSPRRPDAHLEAGKHGLIDNMADLLLHGRRGQETAARYFNVARSDVARRLNMPRDKSDDEMDAWLDRIAEAHGVDERVRDLRADVDHLVRGRRADQRRLVALLGRVARWKQEMLNET